MNYLKILCGIIVLLFILVLPFRIDDFYKLLFADIYIMGLYAASFNLIYGYTGMLSIAHSTFFGFAGFAFINLIQRTQVHFLIAALLALVLTAILSICIGAFVVRTKKHNLIALTVVFSQALFLLARSATSLTGGEDGMVISAIKLGNYAISDPLNRYYIALGFALGTLFLLRAIVYAPLGRCFIAIRDNEDRFKSLPYRLKTRSFRLISFAIGSTLAGLSGVIYAAVNSSMNVESMYWVLSGEAIMWNVIGGVGTLIGPYLGTAFIVLLKEILSSEIVMYYPIFVGAALVFIVIYQPKGLMGMLERLFVRVNRGNTNTKN